MFDWFVRPSQLDRIETIVRLDRIETIVKRMETRMSSQEQGLNAAIGTLTTAVDGIRAAVDAILAKLAGLTDVDLTDETAALETLSASLGEATDALNEALAPEEPEA